MDLMTRYRAMAGVKKGGGLPAGYTEVEYLRSNGNGRINTALTLGTGFCAEVNVRIHSEQTSVFGIGGILASGTANVTHVGLMIQQGAFRLTIAGGVLNSNFNYELNTWYNIKFGIAEGIAFIYINDVLAASTTNVGSLSDRAQDTITMFLQYNGIYGAYCDIDKCIIYEAPTTQNTMSNVAQANLIDCVRDSDNKVGVYDLNNQEFIGATGTLYIPT